jgi:release factor glutamine methyltransferase
MIRLRDALLDTRLPRLEIRWLLALALDLPQPTQAHAWLLAHDSEALGEAARSQFDALVARRLAGEPMAYLLGERDFYGRSFRCSPAALIPRPETEHLVEQVLTLTDAARELAILDVGTGTGCIAITLALELPHAQVAALDVSAAALALARENAVRLHANHVEFIQSDWFSAVPERADEDAKFDLIVSNPPYIVPGDAHLSQGDLRFEPAVALADAVDGLESYRHLARGADKHLKGGGWLVVEHGYDQGDTVPALLRVGGFINVSTHCDLAGHPRITSAQRPAG